MDRQSSISEVWRMLQLRFKGCLKIVQNQKAAEAAFWFCGNDKVNEKSVIKTFVLIQLVKPSLRESSLCHMTKAVHYLRT